MTQEENSIVKELNLSTKAMPLVHVKESLENKSKTYTFHAATTLPDRVRDEKVDGEILTKSFLDKTKELINDTGKLGGKYGAYRTISLFHDRVHAGDMGMEEAGFLLPNSRVVELKEFPGHYALEVDVEVNDMYQPSEMFPDYTTEKIKYKIEKGAMGLSIEYWPLEKEYSLARIDNGTYRVVDDFAEFGGFGFARPGLIGNTSAVAIKESVTFIEVKNMTEDQTIQLKEQMEKLQKEVSDMAQVKTQLKEAEAKGAGNEEQVDALQAKIKELETNSIPAATVKEFLAKGFDSIQLQDKKMNNEQPKINPSLKEVQKAIDRNDWKAHSYATDAFIKENSDMLVESLKKGINIEDAQTIQVKCVDRGFELVPTAKTKDIIDSSDMASTYTQTNAMFADRYVAQITETFLMDDSLLKAMAKEQHLGGNDYYQWRIWTQFIDTSSETCAVNPDITSVTRNSSDFTKLQTPIKEYRRGVEVSDFTQYHSRQAIGDLLGIQVDRQSKIVVESMNADLFKENADGDSVQFLGLEAVADTTGNTTLYGLTRSTTNRLTTGTLADTYNTTSEVITVSVVRAGYEQVLGRGSNLNDIAIVTHPTQVRKLFDSQDNTAATYNSTVVHPVQFDAAPPEFGFKRNLVPHIDGIPIIRDYKCQSDAFYVVDLSREKGFVLVVSKPLGLRGLAKVGTTESAYVNFFGAAVYKSPINVYLHDTLQ